MFLLRIVTVCTASGVVYFGTSSVLHVIGVYVIAQPHPGGSIAFFAYAFLSAILPIGSFTILIRVAISNRKTEEWLRSRSWTQGLLASSLVGVLGGILLYVLLLNVPEGPELRKNRKAAFWRAVAAESFRAASAPGGELTLSLL
jgi:hypothetical protein